MANNFHKDIVFIDKIIARENIWDDPLAIPAQVIEDRIYESLVVWKWPEHIEELKKYILENLENIPERHPFDSDESYMLKYEKWNNKTQWYEDVIGLLDKFSN